MTSKKEKRNNEKTSKKETREPAKTDSSLLKWTTEVRHIFTYYRNDTIQIIPSIGYYYLNTIQLWDWWTDRHLCETTKNGIRSSPPSPMTIVSIWSNSIRNLQRKPVDINSICFVSDRNNRHWFAALPIHNFSNRRAGRRYKESSNRPNDPPKQYIKRDPTDWS